MIGQRTAVRRLRVTLAARLLLATAVLALVVAAVFVALVLTVGALRDANERERRAADATAATLALEKLVLDLETGLRGFAITRNRLFLRPWVRAREDLPARIADVEKLRLTPLQRRRAERLVALVHSYLNEYSLPLVAIARDNPAAARTNFALSEGRRRVEAIRREFTRFRAAENAIALEREALADRQANQAVAVGVGGLIAAVAVIVLFGVYAARSIGRPLRDAAAGARQLAAGDLGHRVAERGPGEIGELARRFNEMAGRLEEGRRELQAQNEQLRRSERQKSELVSIVSHELRTPLASILGFTSLLRTSGVPDDQRERYLEIVETQGRRLSELLDDFLDVQRFEEGSVELRTEHIDLEPILREQVQLFSALSGDHSLELDVRARPLAVRADAHRLAQVVGNLLSNAIKYSPDGGLVRIVGEMSNGAVRVSVQDRGLGIDDAHKQQVFTKFFRGDAGEHGIAGTGLGLAVTRAIVEAHGGHIEFTSAKGEGSIFWIELPLDPDASPAGWDGAYEPAPKARAS